jgi:pimeloyl-ACP methyl ester carboxylesterase
LISERFIHDRVEVNGIAVHTVSVGEGPLVVFCHGFPESWYSWRHQLPAVADAGFKAMALDMRGYGATSAPAAVDAYSMGHIVADVVGVVAATGVERAVVVGHDWGAGVAWYSALMRPDVFRAQSVESARMHFINSRSCRKRLGRRTDGVDEAARRRNRHRYRSVRHQSIRQPRCTGGLQDTGRRTSHAIARTACNPRSVRLSDPPTA